MTDRQVNNPSLGIATILINVLEVVTALTPKAISPDPNLTQGPILTKDSKTGDLIPRHQGARPPRPQIKINKVATALIL